MPPPQKKKNNTIKEYDNPYMIMVKLRLEIKRIRQATKPDLIYFKFPGSVNPD